MFLLLDIGGTKTRLVFAEKEGFKTEPFIFRTSQNFADELREIKEALQGRVKIEGVVAGVPGVLDNLGETLVSAPHLPDWQGKSLQRELADLTGARVILRNDAVLGAIGEAVFGAGIGKAKVVYVTVSTGVGGAEVVAGASESAFDFEPGHTVLLEGETLESKVSGSAFEKKYHMPPKKVSDVNVWEQAAKDLAAGLAVIAERRSPDVIVLGGSMILGDPAIPFSDLLKYFQQSASVRKLPFVEKAKCRDFSGLYGALAVAVENFG